MALLTRLFFACVLINVIAASSDMCEVMTTQPESKAKDGATDKTVFACVLTNFIAASSDMCEVMTINISIFQRNQRLNGFQFYDSTDVPDIFQCAMMCFFRRRCLSFNYFENSSLCEFNNARVDAPYVILNSTTHCVYSDIDDWDKVRDISFFIS